MFEERKLRKFLRGLAKQDRVLLPDGQVAEVVYDLVPGPGSCTLPPEGWYCNLDAGHDGPCPTRMMPTFSIPGTARPQESALWDFLMVQNIVAPDRYYGDGGTIHGTNTVDVVLDPDTGDVTEVWFRCQMLRFQQAKRKGHPMSQEDLPELIGLVIRDPK